MGITRIYSRNTLAYNYYKQSECKSYLALMKHFKKFFGKWNIFFLALGIILMIWWEEGGDWNSSNIKYLPMVFKSIILSIS